MFSNLGTSRMCEMPASNTSDPVTTNTLLHCAPGRRSQQERISEFHFPRNKSVLSTQYDRPGQCSGSTNTYKTNVREVPLQTSLRPIKDFVILVGLFRIMPRQFLPIGQVSSQFIICLRFTTVFTRYQTSAAETVPLNNPRMNSALSAGRQTISLQSIHLKHDKCCQDGFFWQL